MKYPAFSSLLLLILFSSVMLLLGLYLLVNFNRLFRRYIRNEILRKNIVVWIVAICLNLSVSPTNPEFSDAVGTGHLGETITITIAAITMKVLFVFNTTLLVSRTRRIRGLNTRKRMGAILTTIIISAMMIGIPINYLVNKGEIRDVEYSFLFNFYMGCMTGLIYITMNYVELERQRRMNEKELEVSRLRELKTKAELEALHSKINPHFLYNALNSIADLSITDGKKARKMTIGLADLFRFSINYSNTNYSTIKDEIEMAAVYLQIEKIRFEDQLGYSIDMDEELNSYLVPRFVLQPIVENAVKHGLKATGRMTQVTLEVKKENGELVLTVADNGPPFPDELNPGYGARSVYDKLDLLFSGAYEIYFRNQPRKEVSIYLKKLFRNEPGI